MPGAQCIRSLVCVGGSKYASARRVSAVANLASASGCQDHTTSSYAQATLVSRARQRPSHPRLAFRDDWPNAPLIEAGSRKDNIDF